MTTRKAVLMLPRFFITFRLNLLASRENLLPTCHIMKQRRQIKRERLYCGTLCVCLHASIILKPLSPLQPFMGMSRNVEECCVTSHPTTLLFKERRRKNDLWRKSQVPRFLDLWYVSMMLCQQITEHKGQFLLIFLLIFSWNQFLT